MPIRLILALLLMTLMAGCKTSGDTAPTSGVKEFGCDDVEDDIDGDCVPDSDRVGFLAGKQLFRCEAAPGSKLKWIEIAQFDTQQYTKPLGDGIIEMWTDKTVETNGAYGSSQGNCHQRPYDTDESDQRVACIWVDSEGSDVLRAYWPAGVTRIQDVPATSTIEIWWPGMFLWSRFNATCKKLF